MKHFDFVTKLDVSRAAQELNVAPQWDAFTARQAFPGTPHSGTKCIFLRGASTFLSSYEVRAKRKRTGYAIMLPHTTRLVNQALAGMNVKEVGNVMAVSLLPGQEIAPHSDQGAYPDHFERFHIVITSPKGNWFKVEDECVYPEAGDVFLFNHRLTHSVGNPSKEARVNIIVDATFKD